MVDYRKGGAHGKTCIKNDDVGTPCLVIGQE